MISNDERNKIRAFMQDPKFQVIIDIAEQLCSKIEGEPAVMDTEWETIRATIEREGAVKGIRRLIQTFYDEAKAE